MPRGYLKVFQYGSNMDERRLNSPERLNGRAECSGVGRLNGYGIRFDLYSEQNRCGVTDIVESPTEHVLGGIYDVPVRLVVASSGKQSKMDTFEGARPNGTGNYRRIQVKVTRDGCSINAITYVGTPAGRRRFDARPPNEQQVSEKYFGHLAIGAQNLGLPQEYRAYLRKQAGPRTRS